MATKAKTRAGTRNPSRPRDRAATRARILRATGELLAAQGFAALGVNAIARRARVDKVLIYRYFGGMEALLAAYAEEGEFWWSVDDLLGVDLPPPERDGAAAWLALALRRHVGWLRTHPLTMEILSWEMVEPNRVTERLAEVRERRSMALIGRLLGRFPAPAELDVAALSALLGAASNYLAIRARATRLFNGLDLGRRGDWDRLFDMVERIGAALLDPT